MQTPTVTRVIVVTLCISMLPFATTPRAASFDPWVHPRNETYDPSRHYRDDQGTLYYWAENDIQGAVRDVYGPDRSDPVLTVDLAKDVLRVAERTSGTLLPVLLYDSDGDDRVDRTLLGQIEGLRGVFRSRDLLEIDFDQTRWQIGIRYVAGTDGDPTLDRRYLASVDSRTSRIKGPEMPAVGAGLPPGLVILKHREGTPFDLADFIERPSRYIENFDPLTRADDGDDWTAEDGEGRVVTHFDRENLFIVRTEGGAKLDVVWGDVPVQGYAEEFLKLPRRDDNCYSSTQTILKNHDGTLAVVPNRLLYCPEDSFALFDAPPGYEMTLSALHGEEVAETAHMGTSIADNGRLYVRQIYPRHPSRRATGSVLGNIRAGFGDAGRDMKDAWRHLVTGEYETNVHSGQVLYRPSVLLAAPRAVWRFLTIKPGEGIGEVVEGVVAAVQVAADTVSAVDNAVVTPVVQGSVGLAASPAAADRTGDYIGALTQSAVKNLPFGERSVDAFNPTSLVYNNRAFVPVRYTRTDTQLNFDRVMTIVDLAAIGAIHNHNDSSGSGRGAGDGNGGGNGGNGGNGGTPPGPPPGPGPCISRGAPKGRAGKPTPPGILGNAIAAKFCAHPALNGLLPIKF